MITTSHDLAEWVKAATIADPEADMPYEDLERLIAARFAEAKEMRSRQKIAEFIAKLGPPHYSSNRGMGFLHGWSFYDSEDDEDAFHIELMCYESGFSVLSFSINGQRIEVYS